MKGFIEVHYSGKQTLLSVRAIEGIWNNENGTSITFMGDPDVDLPVEESYDEIKQKIEEAQSFFSALLLDEDGEQND